MIPETLVAIREVISSRTAQQIGKRWRKVARAIKNFRLRSVLQKRFWSLFLRSFRAACLSLCLYFASSLILWKHNTSVPFRSPNGKAWKKKVWKIKNFRLCSDPSPKFWSILVRSFWGVPLSLCLDFASSLKLLKNDTSVPLKHQIEKRLKKEGRTKKKFRLWSDRYPKFWSLLVGTFRGAPLSFYLSIASSLFFLKEDTSIPCIPPKWQTLYKRSQKNTKF